jgi:acyl-coenzyme A thioesterase PaaI-like protein
MDDERSRKFNWVDPHPALEVARKVGGLEYTRMVMRGEVPPAPVSELVGFRFVLVEAGEIGIEFDPAEYHYNVVGSVHGGITCTLLDSAMSIAVHTTLPADCGFATLQMNSHFVRPDYGTHRPHALRG